MNEIIKNIDIYNSFKGKIKHNYKSDSFQYILLLKEFSYFLLFDFEEDFDVDFEVFDEVLDLPSVNNLGCEF